MRYFGHKRPVRDDAGQVVDQLDSPAQAITREPLGGAFGPDKARRLIVTMASADLIVLRPERTCRPVHIAAKDVYRLALLARANLANLEKARARKAKRAASLAAIRVARAERRLFRPQGAPLSPSGQAYE